MVSCAKVLMSVGCLGAVMGWAIAQPAQAAPPSTAPAELVSTLEAIETAANEQNLEQLMALYSPGFVGPDGFTREQYQATLSEFWEQYIDLVYEVELLSWENEGTAFVAETLTTVEGTRLVAGRAMQLTAELRSQQRYENGQLVSQAILSEQNQLTAGVTPPDVTIQLADTVAPSSRFTYDAIVGAPLGNRLLLGLAFDEGVTSEDFLTPRPVDLEALTAGGLFKVGTAPEKSDQRWISAVIVREDGIVIDTRRLNVQAN
ncbi:MAG: nuclear transport factor 2 family protein [Cyanobacteria bacterium P01_H01_bin.152]